MTKARASQAPAPFLKWVGGKRQLLTEIEKRAPKNYDKYFEPFLGGGSVLFNFTPHSPVINDINPHLTNTYLQIKNNPQKLFEEIRKIDAITPFSITPLFRYRFTICMTLSSFACFLSRFSRIV